MASEACEGGLRMPPLSPTYRSSQLLTPQQLDRITIDNTRYHGHLTHSLHTHPPHLNLVQRRVQKMGDNYFFVHRDVPVQQAYTRTSLKLSEVRPWDQIVERPLTSDTILRKEVHLPFPAEHPYSSHISRFAVFPDTHPTLLSPPVTKEGETQTVSVHTQTTTSYDTTQGLHPLTPHPPTPYYVLQKASERGQRVECRHVSVPTEIDMRGYNPQWDLPRSHRHKRSYTYPAPTQQFAPHIPAHLPTSTHPPHTQEALHSLHRSLTHRTTYTDHYQGHTHKVQNVLRLEQSRQSQRPWTAESRGKYANIHTSLQRSDKSVRERDHSMMNVEQDGEMQGETNTQHEMDSDEEMSDKLELKLPEAIRDLPGIEDNTVGDKFSVAKVDKATQTDPSLSATRTLEGAPHSLTSDTLPHLTPTTITPSTPHTPQPYTPHKLPQLPTAQVVDPTMPTFVSKRPHTAGNQAKMYIHPKSARVFTPQTDTADHDWLLTADVHTTRSAVSTRRMFNSFSKTEAIRRFQERYPGNVPDLRDYSIQEGRRHVIHGHHAYYYH